MNLQPKNRFKVTYKEVSFDAPTITKTDNANYRSDIELLQSLKKSVDKINLFVVIHGEEAYGSLREKFDEENSANELTDLIANAVKLLKKDNITENDRVLLKQLNRSFYVVNQMIEDFEKKEENQLN